MELRKKIWYVILLGMVTQLIQCTGDFGRKKDEVPESVQVESKNQSREIKRSDDAIDKSIDESIAQIESVKGARVEDICGYTVLTFAGTPNTIVLNFNATVCPFVGKREGKITVSLVNGSNFKDKDAMWQVIYDNYVVTNNNASIKLNGTHTIKNLTGGTPGALLFGLTNLTTVSHLVTSSNMQISFDSDNIARSWNVARKISWSVNKDGFLVWQIEGAGTADGFSNLVTWGTNRASKSFYVQITEPIVFIPSQCGFFRPVSGRRLHTIKTGLTLDYTMAEAFRYNVLGCANGYEIVVQKEGKTKSISDNF